MDLSISRQLSSFLLGMVALLPTMYLIYKTTNAATISAAALTAIIVNLTRIVHILNSFGDLIYQVVELKSTLPRLEVLRSVLREINEAGSSLDLQPRGAVAVNGFTVDDYREVSNIIRKTGVGRYTITGENGSGKSSLLAHLKSEHGDRSHLLAASVAEFSWRDMDEKASTGQALLAALEEVIHDVAVNLRVAG